MRLEVRRANLDDDLRDLFEQYGEQVVAMALALGSNQGTGFRTHPVAPTHAMSVVHANQDAAAKWLMERITGSSSSRTLGYLKAGLPQLLAPRPASPASQAALPTVPVAAPSPGTWRVAPDQVPG
jgi:hypothetical protein